MTSRQKLTLGVLVVVNIVVIAAILIFLQGNNGITDNSSTASETEEAVVDVAETPEVEDNATEIVDSAATPEVEDNATEAVDSATTIDVSNLTSSNNFPPNFDLSVSYAHVYTGDSETLPVSLGAPPAGQKWVMVTGSLFNYEETDAIHIDADHLMLITESGGEYAAEAPNGSINPYLVDTEIPANESLYGFVVYLIPEDETVDRLQWCPIGECTSPLEVVIALVQ